MATTLAPLLSFNRGVISKTTLARTDLDRTRLSAEVMTNWIPKTQGPMILRPGTKYTGSSFNDTGAEWIEFVASTEEYALLELTPQKMRVWLPNDTGADWETAAQDGVMTLMARPPIDTELNLTDTGWYVDSLGGGTSTTGSNEDIIPQMTGETTFRVKITASSANDFDNSAGGAPYQASDNDEATNWTDTGYTLSAPYNSAVPSWWNVNFDTGGVTDNYVALSGYSITANDFPDGLNNVARSWRLLAGNYDTGTYATDTGKWTLEDEQSSQAGWSVREKRSFSLPGNDTGTVEARRHWRLYFTEVGNDTGAASARALLIPEIEMFADSGVPGSSVVLDAGARGSTARIRKKVVVDTGDIGIEHSLEINIEQGPVRIRIGSTEGDEDYMSETAIGSGYHNLAFTPLSDFHITIQSADEVDRVIRSLSIGDTGTVEIQSPWLSGNLDNIRYDQSADIVFVDCNGVAPYKIERRGSGRSWSVVKYEPLNGPFLTGRTSQARLSVAQKRGNTRLLSDVPFFKPTQVGSLFEITHDGQSSEWALGNKDAVTDTIEVTGIHETTTTTDERYIGYSASGTYSGEITIERSFDGPDFGFKEVNPTFISGGDGVDTGTFTIPIYDTDDNITVWYRARMSEWSSGNAIINSTYQSGSKTGRCRITKYNNSQSVDVEVFDSFSDTGSSEEWREGAWSGRRGYPTAVSLHEGRLGHAGQAQIWMSVSDDYENFDDSLEGESAPISRTLGSGPVDTIQYLLSTLRLIAGTTGSEIAIKSSSLDETLTPTNTAANAFSTQGSSKLRAVKLDNKGIFTQRSRQKLHMFGFGVTQEAYNDYDTVELTILTPDMLKAGVRSIAIQRQPDTRIHCALDDGTVAILTYEPKEEVLAWSKWTTDGEVERCMTLPGVEEDQVFYHVKRTINGETKRYLEQWAFESACQGDTGLSWLADCAISNTDTGSRSTISVPHLAGKSVTGWANDTGQGNSYGKDLTPDDTGGDQQLLSIDTGGDLTLTDSGLKHVVVGLPYESNFKSTKLAYAARGATAMTLMKRVNALALILHQTHNNAIFAGGDSGHLDPLPRVFDDGAEVDADKIYPELDKYAYPFDGEWDEDSRLHVRGKAPRPATVMAVLPKVTTNEN